MIIGRQETGTEHRSSSGTQGGAVEQWISEHRSAMLAMARRFEGGMTRADDIVQEALTIAWRRRCKTGPVDSIKGWLLTITRYVGLRAVTKRKRRADHDDTFEQDPPAWLKDDAVEC